MEQVKLIGPGDTTWALYGALDDAHWKVEEADPDNFGVAGFYYLIAQILCPPSPWEYRVPLKPGHCACCRRNRPALGQVLCNDCAMLLTDSRCDECLNGTGRPGVHLCDECAWKHLGENTLT